MLRVDQLQRAWLMVRQELLAARLSSGHWLGELASSALATATAVSALSLVAQNDPPESHNRTRLSPVIGAGLDYLARSQNSDGGWGDTDQSLSNIAATMLVVSAFRLSGAAEAHKVSLERASRYIEAQGGLPALRQRYGRDQTFVVPILTNAALAGLVAWSQVAPLPFELACFPQAWYRFLRLPVVSYAIPALVAIGQARYVHEPPWNVLARWLRSAAMGPSLRVLERMQPASGGYLEATPLTSFVVMSLAGTGRSGHPVVRAGTDFLLRAARPDGSWPIDTNLATWVTTLAVNALAGAGEEVGRLGCTEWLLSCQQEKVHPFTGARPGGWGWTDLSGAVPDADDTAGALLALAALRPSAGPSLSERIEEAAGAGVAWLVDLQNRDGGWPTFCRGWGKLPFDRSGADLTAHALRALHAWTANAPHAACLACAPGTAKARCSHRRVRRAIRRGLAFLQRTQRADGSWVPLWFGNQHAPGEESPVYGTARCLLAYRDLGLLQSGPAQRGVQWLLAHQRPDGGWGTPMSAPGTSALGTSGVEETGLALEALLAAPASPAQHRAMARGLQWLVEAIRCGAHRQPAPIGFYFAKLWYYERMYPLVFAAGALGAAVRHYAAAGV